MKFMQKNHCEECEEKDAEIAALTLKGKCLEEIIRETFWMARRYAHGRHTTVSSTIRRCYEQLKKHAPELLPKKDYSITGPTEKEVVSRWMRDDYLDDCND